MSGWEGVAEIAWRCDPELVVGVVTPVGTNTADFVARIRGALAEWNYGSTTIKLSDYFDSSAPSGEHEDERILRLIAAGNDWCREQASVFGVAPLACQQISVARVVEHQRRGRGDDPGLAAEPLSRHAFLLHSLKRPGEVELLRYVYGDAFVLLATDAPVDVRLQTLSDRLRTHVTLDDEDLRRKARDLINADAAESDEFGQDVAKTYPLADVFIAPDRDPDRAIALLFGDSTQAPTVGESAMFAAWATAARSLTASRRVGAAIVRNGSLLSVGMNEVPGIFGLTPDAVLGYDYSELEKQELAIRAAETLAEQGWLDETKSQLLANDRDEFDRSAVEVFRNSPIMDVIEYQRAVHAEMWAILDAAKRGVSLQDTEMYGTTYPCHLCWKHVFTSGIKKMYYIDTYPKSRAESMYAPTHRMLEKYIGVAPRKYLRFFQDRELIGADRAGRIESIRRDDAQPLVRELPAEAVMAREAVVLTRLNPESPANEGEQK
jgi:deoxycytidylate deaminase